MQKLALLATVAAALTVAPALAQPQPNSGQTPPTSRGTASPGGAPSATVVTPRVHSATEFMRMAEMSDRFEIGSSRLAEERAQNQQVKQFAQEMVRDHTQTTQKLTQLMQQMQGTTGAQTSSASPPANAGASNARTGSGTTPPGATSGGSAMTTAQGGVQSQGLDAEHRQMLQRLQNARGAEFDRLYMQMQVQAHQQAVDMFTTYSQQGDNAQLKQFAAQTLPTLQQHLQRAQQVQRSL